MTKKCNHCGEEKDESLFYTKTVKGKKYLRFICKRCENLRKKKMPSYKRYQDGYIVRRKDKRKEERKDPEFRPRYILEDSRRVDKRSAKENDLDLDFIRQKISQECFYCGENSIQMTLDRIDNSLGHLKRNVVPSCARCNFIRKDMPFPAWVIVSEGIRKARISGLFGEWTGSIHR